MTRAIGRRPTTSPDPCAAVRNATLRASNRGSGRGASSPARILTSPRISWCRHRIVAPRPPTRARSGARRLWHEAVGAPPRNAVVRAHARRRSKPGARLRNDGEAARGRRPAATRSQPPLHRVVRTADRRRNPLRPGAQRLQPHHRRHADTPTRRHGRHARIDVSRVGVSAAPCAVHTVTAPGPTRLLRSHARPRARRPRRGRESRAPRAVGSLRGRAPCATPCPCVSPATAG